MPYIPPHLRPGWVPPPPPAPKAPKPRGVHYKSNNTGLPSTNLQIHRYEKNAPTKTFTIGKRKLRVEKVPTYRRKSALKGKSKHRQTRAAKSNEKTAKHVRKTHKAHSQ